MAGETVLITKMLKQINRSPRWLLICANKYTTFIIQTEYSGIHGNKWPTVLICFTVDTFIQTEYSGIHGNKWPTVLICFTVDTFIQTEYSGIHGNSPHLYHSWHFLPLTKKGYICHSKHGNIKFIIIYVLHLSSVCFLHTDVGNRTVLR